MFEDVSNSRIIFLIDEWIKSARDREIMKDRLINGFTYEALAEKYDMSVRQIKNIAYKNNDLLLRHLR